MPSLLLIDYLERSRATWQLIQHRPAATAEDAAVLLGVPARQFGKVVMLRVAGELVMMVVPAHNRVRAERLAAALAAPIELAQPRHFLRRFHRCEAGAMPPFGHLFGLRSIGSALPEAGDIFFKAGSHCETVTMPVHEFRRLAHIEELPGCAGAQARPRTQTLFPHLRQPLAPALLPRPGRGVAFRSGTLLCQLDTPLERVSGSLESG